MISALGVSIGPRWDLCVWKLARIFWELRAKSRGPVSVKEAISRPISSILQVLTLIICVAPGQFTIHNFPCSEDGKNCIINKKVVDTQHYEDPSKNIEAVHRRLKNSDSMLRN